MGLVESPEGVVVRALPAGQPEEGNLVPSARFQLARRKYSRHEPIQPNAQQRAGVIGGGAQRLALHIDAESGPFLLRQSVDEARNKAHRVIVGEQIV